MSNGILAGAVGATALNAATYLDMALTGRAPSNAPADTVLAAADHLDVALDTDGSRPEAYGALVGAATGVAVGVLAAGVRAAGVRLPLLAEAAVIGAGAMAATDGPMHALGVSDVSTWSSEDWVRDAVPHYAYGLAVAGTLRGLERREAVKPAVTRRTPARPRGRVLTKAFALGLATGGRSSLGLLPSAGAVDSRLAKLAIGGGVLGELVMDKQPSTPARTQTGPFVGRAVLGAVGGMALSRDDSVGTLLPAVAGAAGAALGTVAGLAWREKAAEAGASDLRAALLEDGAAALLAVWAARR
ncbi:hypothetical protein KLP28_07430 [Nocardioidaceae bacterium]|nr:hypothetical protein KLP28_07430 [Nocardioidaceae bacterium]